MRRYYKIKVAIIAAFAFLFSSINVNVSAQTVTIDLGSASTVDFTFNTINKLTNGIVIPNAVSINIECASGQWDLYAGTVTTIANTWDNVQYYTITGNGVIPVNILQMRVHNLSNTPQTSGYVPLEDVATSSIDIIGNHLIAPDVAVNCSDLVKTGTNTPGSYVTDPQCYQFRVDLKMTPGIIYRPGVYTLQIEFIIAEDL